MKKRLLALVMGLFPTAFAAGQSGNSSSSDGVSTRAMTSDKDYTISFVKDAFNITQIGVRVVDGSSPPANLSGQFNDATKQKITLDGASFSIGDGSMSPANMVAGYGLMDVTTTKVGTYYYQYATWERSLTADPVTSLTYEDIKAHAGQTLYLNYRTSAGKLKVPVTAVSDTGETLAQKSDFVPGDITEAQAQEVVAGLSSPYYFQGAELRPKSGTASPIPITYVNLLNGCYYVKSSLSSNSMDAFDINDWDVYLVYEQAYKLTLHIEDPGNHANNKVNGVHRTTGDYVYQIPKNGVLELTFGIGTNSNLTVTNTTGGGNNVLFNSATSGYQIKEYTLTLTGSMLSGDQTVTANYENLLGKTSFTLDYSHYIDSPNSYHGNEVKLFPGGGSNGTALDKNSTTTTIKQGDILRFYCNASSASYLVNTLVLNGTALNLPAWEWGGKGTHEASADTTIYDSAGNVMAQVTTSVWIQYQSSTQYTYPKQADFYITFKVLNNNIKLDRANMAPVTFPDLIIYEMGDGLNVEYYNNASMASEDDRKPAPIGCGIYPLENGAVWVTPEFGYYVTQFRMGESDALIPTTDTGTTWYGAKTYRTNDGGSGAPSTQNRQKITDAGSSPGYIKSDLIDYSFQYDWDGNVGDGYYTDSAAFNLGMDNLATSVLDASLQPNAPAGTTFVGWSLTPTNGGYVDDYYLPGQSIPRDVVAANKSAITYGNTGKAVINLYPVFENNSNSPYVSYTVTIHVGNATYTLPFTGGMLGSSLDRDLVMALGQVSSYIGGLTDNYVMDGARSDSLVELTGSGSNAFNLYYVDTDPVNITFVSPYGFTDGTTGSEQTKTGKQTPGSIMEVPTPYEGDGANASFIGWSLDKSATTGMNLTNALVPYGDTTYYAIYAPNHTVSFYTWTEADSWGASAALTASVGNGQTIPTNKKSEINALTPNITGYNFQGWAKNGPSGPTVQVDALMQTTFTTDTDYYAVYTPRDDISVTLNANGGTFGAAQNTKTLSNQVYGQTMNYGDAPTREGGYVFAGWSTDKSATVGQLTITAPATPGATYYAVWILPQLEVTANGPFTYDGTTKTPTLTVKYNGKEVSSGDYKVQYSSDTRANAGTYTVLVTYQDLQGIATFIVEPKAINDSSVTVENIAQQEYTGSELRPGVTIKDGEKTLNLNADYVVSYSNNTKVGGGATVTIQGIGNYKASTSKTFQIVPPANISIAAIPDQEYTGKAVTPDLVVYDSNGRMLTKETDYTANFTNNTNVGNANVSVIGKGNYAGKTANSTFRITAAGNALTVTVDPVQMTTSQGAPTITVSSGNVQLSADNDYTLSYQMYGENGALQSTNASMTAAGIYLITANGRGSYQGATGSATFVRIPVDTGNDLTITGIDADNQVLTYNGQNQNTVLNGLKVQYQDSNLSASDYDISIQYNNTTTWNSVADAQLINAGTYLVTVTAKNTYSGTANLTIYIQPKNIADENIVVDGTLEAVYNGQAHDHPFTVTDNAISSGTELIKDTDYTLVDPDHAQHTDVGSYPLTITGKGNYNGTREVTYTITPATGTAGTGGGLTIAPIQNQTYTGNAIEPEVTVSFDSTPLTKDTHYTVKYDFNVNAGLGVVTVTGKTGTNYEGMTGSATFTIEPKNIASLTVNGIKNANYTGSPIRQTITIQDGGKTLVEGTDYYVEYSSNINVGTATVTIYGINNYKGTNAQNFTISTVDIGGGDGDTTTPGSGFGVAVYPPTGVYTGVTHNPAVVVTYNGVALDANSDYTLMYKTLEGVDVGAGGMIDVGTYVITVTGQGNYTGTVDARYTITPVSDSSTGAGSTLAIAPIDSKTYTGDSIKPTVSVTYNGQVVQPDAYTVSYSANVNVGQATVIVSGNADTNYEGMVGATTFTITPKDITLDDISVGAIPDQTYTGSAIEPELTITDMTRQAELIMGADYILGYKNNVDVSSRTATAVITGRGNYTGTKEVTFNITQANIGGTDTDPTTPGTDFAVEVYPSKGAYTAKAHTPAVMVHYKGLLLEENKDYYVTYTKDSDSSDVTASGMIEVGTYTITVTGKGNYSGSVTVKYEITAADSSQVLITEPISDVEYTGSPIEPSLEVSYSGQELTKDRDYTVSYETDNVNAGVVVVKIQGQGETYGDLSTTSAFQITRKDIASSDISLPSIGSQTYTGGYITPAATVTDGTRSEQLVLNKDYTVEYSNNLNVGEATVTIRGIGNYSGQRTTTFQIAAADVSKPGTSGGDTGGITANVYPNSGVFNGTSHAPAVIVTHDGAILVYGKDYELSYANQSGGINANGMIDVGEYTITVTGKGNYTGVKTATYTITPVDGQSSGTLVIDKIADVTYNGSEQQPAVTVTYNGATLNADTDYDVTYSNNVNAGLATVKVIGKDNYENMTGIATFNIRPKEITLTTVDPIDDQTYTVRPSSPRSLSQMGIRSWC